LNIFLLIFEISMFAISFRDNEVLMRKLYKSKEKNSTLSKLVGILQHMPDAVIISDNDKPLFLN
jgi:hypothetical protein